MQIWYIFLSFFKLSIINASLDLFIDTENAKKLIGVPSEVWYVKEGKVKTYALNYIVKVPNNLNVLTFHWQNLASATMPYSLDINVSNGHALQKPSLRNIKRNGLVPNQLRAWSVTVNCTGRFVTQSHVNITLNVPISHSLQNITSIVIQRMKICSELTQGIIAVGPIHRRNSTNVVYITVGFLALFLIIVASLGSFSHIRNNKRRIQNQRRRNGCITAENSLPNNQVSHPCPINCPSFSNISRAPEPSNTTPGTTTNTSITSPDFQFTDPREFDLSVKLQNVEVCSPSSLTLQGKELEGTFGRVHMGSYLPTGAMDPISVIVKTVCETASEVQESVLLVEALMLSGISHKNILPVLAANATIGSPFVLFPCSGHTNLKKYLQQCHTLLTKEVVSLGSQILDALSFLHSKLFLHKDVASRNCVVNETLQVKLTDCALSRDIFPGDYHCLGDNENRPVKWLAVESLMHKVFSPASDVWSWSVLVWEIMTLGQQPYIEIDPFEMATVLKQGVRLAQPINCPDELFKAMTLCWATIPAERPSVDALISYLNNFLEHLNKYI